jgi:uncharacterized membrane protein HdeD (DUF308 family)
MKNLLVSSWWVLALRGAIAIAFGVLALLWPGLTLLALVALFAAYALFGGVVALAGAVRARRRDRDWWLMLLLGIVSIAAGLFAVFAPGITAVSLVLLIGANALITGVIELVMAVRLRRTIEREWMLGLAGVFSVLFGGFVLLFPAAGALAIVWLIAVHAIAIGILFLTLSFRAHQRGERSWERMPERGAHA